MSASARVSGPVPRSASECESAFDFHVVGLEWPILALIPGGLGNVAWRTASDEPWHSCRRVRHGPPCCHRPSGARLVSSVAIVSVVWFTSTSKRHDQIVEPYKFITREHFLDGAQDLGWRSSFRNGL